MFLRVPQIGGLSSLGATARGEPKLPGAMGAGVAVGRSDAVRVSAAACGAMPTTCAAITPIRSSSSARRTKCLVGGLMLARISGVASCRRERSATGSARQHARKGYMTRRAARAVAVCLRRLRACTASKLPASPPMFRRSACWRNAASCARARAALSLHQRAPGRTTISTALVNDDPRYACP